MTSRRSIAAALALLVLVSGVASGCTRGADTVTIYDPNTTGSFRSPSEVREPVAAHGADTMVLALAIAKARAHLSVARTLITNAEPAPARDHVEAITQDGLPAIQARTRLANPALDARLRRELLAAAAATAADKPRGIAAIDRVGKALDEIELALIPADVQADDAWRAAVFATVVFEVDAQYGQAVSGGDEVALVESYRLAYGLLQVARTHYLAAAFGADDPAHDRLERDLAALSARAMPGPTPPQGAAAAADDVSNKVGTITDVAMEAANMDVTPAPPTRDAVERLRLLGTALEAAARHVDTGSPAAGRRTLRTAYRTHVLAIAPALASVDQVAITQLEYLVGVRLQDAVDDPAVFHSSAAEAQSVITSARELVEQEVTTLEQERLQEES